MITKSGVTNVRRKKGIQKIISKFCGINFIFCHFCFAYFVGLYALRFDMNQWTYILNCIYANWTDAAIYSFIRFNKRQTFHLLWMNWNWCFIGNRDYWLRFQIHRIEVVCRLSLCQLFVFIFCKWITGNDWNRIETKEGHRT